MTISATTPQRNATGAYNHRQTKSGSAINYVPLSHPKLKLHHQAHQIQSPPPKEVTYAPKSDSTPHKKRRRQRKPKDIPRQPSPSSNTSESPSTTTSEPMGITAIEPKTPTKTPDSTPPGKVYAGPGFHHSPAPSSLPVPKFFSKSMPSNRSPGLQAMMEEFDNTDESTSSSPPSDGPGPLDVLFKAHRKELAERRADNSSDSDSIPDTPGRDIFGMDPDSPVRLRFKTPRNNSGRMTVHRAITDYTAQTTPLFSKPANSPAQGVTLPPTPEDTERQNKSAALRQMLLQKPADPTPLSPSPIGRSQGSPQVSPLLQRDHASQPSVGKTAMKGPPFPVREYAQPREPIIYQNYSPIRPQFSNIFDQWRADKHCRTETNEMTAMENSLRQILKLDPRVEGVTI